MAKTALDMAENKIMKNSTIFSYVKKNNIRSFKFFLKCDYKVYATSQTMWKLKIIL